MTTRNIKTHGRTTQNIKTHGRPIQKTKKKTKKTSYRMDNLDTPTSLGTRHNKDKHNKNTTQKTKKMSNTVPTKR